MGNWLWDSEPCRLLGLRSRSRFSDAGGSPHGPKQRRMVREAQQMLQEDGPGNSGGPGPTLRSPDARTGCSTPRQNA